MFALEPPQGHKCSHVFTKSQTLRKRTSASDISDCIVTQNSVAVVPKGDNLALEMPDRGRAAAAAGDVTRAMRSALDLIL